MEQKTAPRISSWPWKTGWRSERGTNQRSLSWSGRCSSSPKPFTLSKWRPSSRACWTGRQSGRPRSPSQVWSIRLFKGYLVSLHSLIAVYDYVCLCFSGLCAGTSGERQDRFQWPVCDRSGGEDQEENQNHLWEPQPSLGGKVPLVSKESSWFGNPNMKTLFCFNNSFHSKNYISGKHANFPLKASFTLMYLINLAALEGKRVD